MECLVRLVLVLRLLWLLNDLKHLKTDIKYLGWYWRFSLRALGYNL